MTDLKDKLLIKPEEVKRVHIKTLKVLSEIKTRLEQLHARWSPHNAQKPVLKSIFSDNKKKIFCRSGRRSGKTDVAIYIALRKAILVPNSRILIVAKTLKQAKKIYWKSGKITKMLPVEWGCNARNEDSTIYFPNGSYIEIDGSDDLESHRGTEYNLVIIDEFKDIKAEFYSEIINPTLATTDGTLVVIGTPPKSRNNHYFELEAEAKNDTDWGFFHWTSHDNPYVSKKFLASEERKYVARGEADVWKREFLAEYSFGGKDAILPQFSRRKHLKSLENMMASMKLDWNRLEWYICCDPATSSTFAVLFIAYDRGSNRVFVLDEIYAREKRYTSSSVIYQNIQEKANALNPEAKWEWIYDEAAAWFANEMQSQYNISMFPSKKSLNDKEEGISLWKDLLIADNLFACNAENKHFIFEIESYIMENDKYPKILDHLLDAFRYFLGHVNINFSYLVPTEDEAEANGYLPPNDDYNFNTELKEYVH